MTFSRYCLAIIGISFLSFGVQAETPVQKQIAASEQNIVVHRDANCGCCKNWITYLEGKGYSVTDKIEADMSTIKLDNKISPAVQSCHTGLINGKFVEGHVPVETIDILLSRDDLIGIAAPGMPVGSPGMEVGDRIDTYQILGIKKDGSTEVVATFSKDHPHAAEAHHVHQAHDHSHHGHDHH